LSVWLANREREINRTLKDPLFVREWIAVTAGFSHDTDFLDYMGSPQRADRGPRCNEAIARAKAAIQAPSCGRLLSRSPS
jgi:hypothetical protein